MAGIAALVRPALGGDLRAQLGKLGLQRRAGLRVGQPRLAFALQRLARAVGLLLQLADLLGAGLRLSICTGQQVGRKGELGGRRIVRIACREPDADVEQLAQCARPLAGGELAGMRGAVADAAQDINLAVHRRADEAEEARLCDQRGEMVAVGALQIGVVIVEPAHHRLDREPAMHRRPARIG